jgi:hypothetical protein
LIFTAQGAAKQAQHDRATLDQPLAMGAALKAVL